MSTPRDIQASRSAVPHHRQSLGTTPISFPTRQASSRAASQSLSVGSYAQSHRVNRRKSTASSAGFNVNALAAALKETGPFVQSAKSKSIGKLDHFGKSTNASRMDLDQASDTVNIDEVDEDAETSEQDTSAIVDGPPLSSVEKTSAKSRTRRASEGQKVGKLERSKSNAGELRCDKCGKGYKHGSCLTKHLWEHTPEWALTSKLLISKHQQVQLLEAASVLVAMNQDDNMPMETVAVLPRHDRDTSSESPVPSGSSDHHEPDDLSSRTSTPSQDESDEKLGRYQASLRPEIYARDMARSYQSMFGSSAPMDAPGISYYRQWSSESRPTSLIGVTADDNGYSDLAAAAEGLLSCSLGTPKVGIGHLSADIPPVPPLPAKYSAGTQKSMTADRSTKGDHVDVQMADEADVEDDEGIFGQMD